jgi:hypothetical protein
MGVAGSIPASEGDVETAVPSDTEGILASLGTTSVQEQGCRIVDTGLSGLELLAIVPTLQRQLTTDEVEAVASALNQNTVDEVKCKDTDRPYLSQDLYIGSERNDSHETTDHQTPAMEQFDVTTQEEAFRLIKSDHRIEQQLVHSQAWIKFDGVERSFYHYQIYAAYWLIRTERITARRGSIEADLMGLGKVSWSAPVGEKFKALTRFRRPLPTYTSSSISCYTTISRTSGTTQMPTSS